MRMVKKNKKEVYIAEDGKKFSDQHSCELYERENVKATAIEVAETLRIKELDEVPPLDTSGIVNCDNIISWFKVNNANEFRMLNTAFNNCLSEPKVYPETVCVETAGREEYEDDCYDYHLSLCKQWTETFWKKFGCHAEIKILNDKQALIPSEKYLRTFSEDSKEYDRLKAAAHLISAETGKTCIVKDTWFDIGQDWKYTTILIESGLSAFPFCQVLTPKQQEKIVCSDTSEWLATVEEVVKKNNER